MAAAFNLVRSESIRSTLRNSATYSSEIRQPPEFIGVFRGRELTRKDCRLPSGLVPIDNLIGGGIIRGRISEIIGDAGSGKTSLAALFIANVTRRGEAAAWIDATDNFDPESIASAGVELHRMLWTSCRHPNLPRRFRSSEMSDLDAVSQHDAQRPQVVAILKAAEWILNAGGFGIVVIDFGEWIRTLPQSSALRLARAAERNGTAVLALASHRMCGTFAALSLAMRRRRACFSHGKSGTPALFEGLEIETRVARNKLGGSGDVATWQAIVDVFQNRTPDDAHPHQTRIVNFAGRGAR